MEKTPTRTWLWWALGTVALLLVTAGVFAFATSQPAPIATPTQKPAASPTPTPSPTPTRVEVSALGDMLPHDTVNQYARQPDGTYNYLPMFSEVTSLIENSGVVFCNQEVMSGGAAFGITGYPSFNAPEDFARDLSLFGCNTINLANNHSNDKGQGAIDVTRATWDGLSPLMIGGANRNAEEQNTVSFAEIDGIRFAFVALAEYSNVAVSQPYSVNFLTNTALVENLMQQARAGADVVLVSTHWGTEYSNGVNSQQQTLAAQLAALGADVIIGTGPHVLEPVEWIPGQNGKQTLVWYSIGNFLSTQLEIAHLIGGVAQFDVVKNLDDSIVIENPRFLPTYMHYEWTPAQAAAGDLLARTNLKVYPLGQAVTPLSLSLFNTSVEAQYEYVRSVLGPAVTVE
jgi:poly-gamma-glutamate synthesis protein (capsule biosynthesis protein)